MPLLRMATAALKGQHRSALCLTQKMGLTLGRLANASRLGWASKGLTHQDVKVLASIGQFIPRLGELDLRYNKIGDKGLMELALASARGWLPELTALSLGNCAITTKGAQAFATAVAGSSPGFLSLESVYPHDTPRIGILMTSHFCPLLSSGLSSGLSPGLSSGLSPGLSHGLVSAEPQPQRHRPRG